MMQDNYTLKCSHLTSTERVLIDKWHKERLSNRHIAKRLGRSPQTINNELRRGLVRQMDTARRYYLTYSPEYAQRQYEMNRKRSTKQTKLDKRLSTCIVHYIKDKVSPEVIAKVKLKGQVSTRTIYNWIY